MSLPQTPTRRMRTRASPGGGDPGLGRSVSWKSPGFSNTIVFMADSILKRQTWVPSSADFADYTDFAGTSLPEKFPQSVLQACRILLFTEGFPLPVKSAE